MALTETKNLNAMILKKYWKLMKHVNLCTIGGFQCLLLNIDYQNIRMDTHAHTKYRTVNISFDKLWCLYRNCHLDFVIYYRDVNDTNIIADDQFKVHKSDKTEEVIATQVMNNCHHEITIHPVTTYIHPNRLIKYFSRFVTEISPFNRTEYKFYLSPEFKKYTIFKVSPIGPIKYEIPIFNEITTGDDAVEMHRKYLDGNGILGSFTGDGLNCINIHYEYNNEYMWYHLNHLLRQNVEYKDKDYFLTSNYEFPKHDRIWRPITNRGINGMNLYDLSHIGFQAAAHIFQSTETENYPDAMIDILNVVLVYEKNQPTEGDDE